MDEKLNHTHTVLLVALNLVQFNVPMRVLGRSAVVSRKSLARDRSRLFHWAGGERALPFAFASNKSHPIKHTEVRWGGKRARKKEPRNPHDQKPIGLTMGDADGSAG